MTNNNQKILEYALTDPLLVDYDVLLLQKLAKTLSKTTQQSTPEKRITKVAVCGGFMTKFLLEILPLFFLHRGLRTTFYESEYGTFHQDILNENSRLADFCPDLVLLVPTHRDLRFPPTQSISQAKFDENLKQEVEYWNNLIKKINSPVIFFTFDPPPIRPLAEADGLKRGGFLNYVRAVNCRLCNESSGNIHFIDTERLSAAVGLDYWHDQRLFHLAKQPISMDALPLTANSIAALASALMGTARKVLVLDLDNTLWGGVLGDEGLEGIAIGPETAEGEAFATFQKYVKNLSERGIILAVCSKNDKTIALKPFKRHSGMVLEEDDFAVFIANYRDKASNLRDIASRLNVGLDSIVFADDSKVECELVKKEIPEIWTLELLGDPSDFPALIDHFLPFPVGNLTKEDFTRNNTYKDLVEINNQLETTTNLDAFLSDLQSDAIIENIRDDTITRITQLLAKTNQFKLNPTLYSKDELKRTALDVIAIRLKDRLQDYGIISVVVFETDSLHNVLNICNWVMSCRVFSRRIEFLIMEQLTNIALERGLNEIQLQYIPSDKNSLLADLLPELGFRRKGEQNYFVSKLAEPASLPKHYINLRNNFHG